MPFNFRLYFIFSQSVLRLYEKYSNIYIWCKTIHNSTIKIKNKCVECRWWIKLTKKGILT